MFLDQTVRMLNLHGITLQYNSIQGDSSSYNVETGTVTRTVTQYSIKAYPKHIKANQYNYPDLVGKTACIFYIANSGLAFTLKFQDEIVYGGFTYKIQSWTEHFAEGQICLYKVLAVKA